jgi:hypothetical protein
VTYSLKQVRRWGFGVSVVSLCAGCGSSDATTDTTNNGSSTITPTTSVGGAGGAAGGTTSAGGSAQGGAGGGTTSAGGAGGATTSAGGAGGATTSAGGAGGGTTTSAGGAGGAVATGGAGGAPQVCQPGAMTGCYTGPAGTEGVGVCKAGTQTCAPDGMSWGPCDGQVLPSPETCKTPVDDDCNGVANEGGLDCACKPGSTQSCYDGPPGTENVGICASGTATCANDGTGWGPCIGEILPAVENCLAAADEDCDGKAPKCTGDYEWAIRAGDAAAQVGRAVALGSEGTAVVVGSFAGALDLGCGTMFSAGVDDAFIGRLSGATGDCVWSKRFGDASAQRALAVAVTPVGEILVAGDFAGMVNLGGGPLNSSGATDVFIAKLDALGNHIWSKRFGDKAAQTLAGLTTDKDGNVYATGSFAGAIDFGGNPLASSGVNDVYVVKLDKDGNHLWSARYGNASDQTAAGIAVDLAGDVALTGSIAGAIDFGGGALTSAGSTDVFVAKLDPTGNHLWSKKWGDLNAQTAASVAFDLAGEVVVTGHFVGTVNLGTGPLKSAGSSDVFLGKFSAAGDAMWSQRFGDAAAQTAAGVAVDPTGAIVITGNLAGSANFGGGILTSAGATDVYLAKFDGLGNAVWSKIFGNAQAQVGYAVAASSAQVLVTGTVVGSINFGGGPLNSAGSTDVFVASMAP